MTLVRAKYHADKVIHCECGYTCLPDVPDGHVYLVDPARIRVFTAIDGSCKRCRKPITGETKAIWAQGHGFIYLGMLELDEGLVEVGK